MQHTLVEVTGTACSRHQAPDVLGGTGGTRHHFPRCQEKAHQHRVDGQCSRGSS